MTLSIRKTRTTLLWGDNILFTTDLTLVLNFLALGSIIDEEILYEVAPNHRIFGWEAPEIFENIFLFWKYS